jgi:hypothetical protein
MANHGSTHAYTQTTHAALSTAVVQTAGHGGRGARAADWHARGQPDSARDQQREREREREKKGYTAATGRPPSQPPTCHVIMAPATGHHVGALSGLEPLSSVAWSALSRGAA